MNKWMLSLRYNTLSQLKEKGFWISLLVLIVLFGSYIGFVTFMGQEEAARKDRVVVLNETSLPIEQALQATKLPYEWEFAGEEKAVQALIRSDEVQALFVIKGTGTEPTVTYFDDLADGQLQLIVASAVQTLKQAAVFSANNVTSEVQSSILAPITPQFQSVLNAEEEEQLSGSIVLHIALLMVMYLFTMLYPQQLAMSLISAKNSRATESLFTRMTPSQFLFGKIGANTAVTLVLICCLFAGLLVSFEVFSDNTFVQAVQSVLTLANISIFLLCYLLIMLFCSALHTIFSSFVSRIEDYSNLAFIAVLLPVVGFMLSVTTTTPSDFTALKEAVTFVPGAGVYLILTGSLFGKLSGTMIALAVAAQIVYTTFLVRFAANVYRRLMFSYEASFTWRALLGMVKR
ncbi:MAG: ABC transporter permease [Bacilli bacterium]